MEAATTLFSQPDLVDLLIEESMPWFIAYGFALAIVLAVYLAGAGLLRLRQRSPVEQLLRRARRSLGEGGKRAA